ncbi:hypothetical protein VTG60DRAFT_4523 [Thermothelomyces hinnuleus]
MSTGDERPPEEKFVWSPSGSVLVRLGGGGGGGGQRCAPGGRDRPMGFTRAGEEILASYARARDCGGVRCYFQFWGSAAAGALGEAFTHVAVMTALAVCQDEEDETVGRRRRRKFRKKKEEGKWGKKGKESKEDETDNPMARTRVVHGSRPASSSYRSAMNPGRGLSHGFQVV